jgi:hypothetical protein
MSTDFGVWVGAFFTLCILSFLYRDNPFFRFAESVFAGVSLGYYIGIVADNTLVPNLFEPLLFADGVMDPIDRWLLLVPLGLGMILYARYIPKIAWLSRWALAIYVGYYMGLQMMQKLQGEVQPQAADTILSLANGISDPGMLINNLVIVVGVLTVLVYFYFSAEHKGTIGGISRVGIWFLMVSFGAAFGYTVMGRVSILIGRINWLFTEWIGIG